MPRGRVPALLLLLAAAAAAQAFDLQGAVDRAAPGSTVRVPPGTYPAPLVIRKPLTLVAAGRVVITGRDQGDVVIVRAPDVTVRGFVIRGTGKSLDRENAGITVLAPRARLLENRLEDVLFGIYLKKAPGTLIRGNRIGGKRIPLPQRGDGIRLWYSSGCRIEDNEVHDSRDVVIWFSRRVVLRRNRIHHGRYGLHFMYSDTNVMEENELTDNSVGGFLMYSRRLTFRRNLVARNRGPSGYGLGLKDMDDVVVEGNLILANRVGVYLDNSPAAVTSRDAFRGNVFAYNDIGVAFQPSVARNDFAGNVFHENVEQVAILGGGRFHGNRFTVAGRGNYWSDYTGFDLDGDGIGDLPYRPVSLFENLMDREPLLRLFLYSPAQQAVEMAARAFPIMRPRPKLTDTAPLVRPPAAAALAPPRRGGPLALFGAALTLLVGMGWLGLRFAREAPRAADAPPAPSSPLPPGPLVRVAGLTKRFGRVRAVDGVSFAVAAGEAVALWGPNGAGKTTVLKCLLGLYRRRGEVTILGLRRRRHLKAVRRRIGYVAQELAFPPDLRARELVAFYARLRRLPAERVDAVLREVDLAEQAAKPVAALSGGMKQRLALAVALLADPPLLLLDEPTSNLDAASRLAFLELLRGLKARRKTILFSTHRLEEVLGLADRVLVMAGGRVERECRPAEVATAATQTILTIPVAAEDRERARRALEEAGFPVETNGRALRVRVAAERRAAPLRALFAAGVAVETFAVEGNRD